MNCVLMMKILTALLLFISPFLSARADLVITNEVFGSSQKYFGVLKIKGDKTRSDFFISGLGNVTDLTPKKWT